MTASRNIIKRFSTVILLVVLLFLACIPRSIELFNKNYLFLFDQGRDYLAVKNIVVDHKLTLIGAEVGAGSAGLSYIFHGPGYYYSLAIPFLLFHGDPYGGIVLMWCFSIAAIVVGFFLGKEIFKSKLMGIVVSILIGASPPLIDQARFVWNSHPTTFFIVLGLYFTYCVQKRSFFLFLAAFTFGIIYHFELAVAVPLSIGLVVYTLFILRLKRARDYVWLFSGFLLSYAPMFLFEARHGFQGTKNLVIYLTSYHTSVAKTNGTSFYIQLLNHLDSFAFNLSKTFPTYNYLPWFVIGLLLCITTVYLIRQEKNESLKNFILFLYILIPITFLVFAPLRNTVWDYYLVHLNIVYIVLFAYSLLRSQQHKYLFIGINVFFILFVSVAINNAIGIWQHDYNDYGGNAKIKGKVAALEYIFQDAKQEKFGLIAFDPAVYTYAFDYLSWWYGNKKYGYEPYHEKKGLVYLVMQVDTNNPWSYKGWLETVIKTGTVVTTKQFLPDLIIQKRRFK